MTAPFTFASGTPAASATPSVTVGTATGAGDTLVVSILSASATVSSVTDSAGNVYTQQSNPASSNVWVYVSDGPTGGSGGGPTAALSTSSTVTAHLSASANIAINCSDLPGTAAIDVNTNASGTSTTPTVSGTPAQGGETALAVYAWAAPGGTGSVTSPFTELTQVTGGGPYLTTAYDQNPPSGSSLTAAASISSTPWTVILLTFKRAGSGALLLKFP